MTDVNQIQVLLLDKNINWKVYNQKSLRKIENLDSLQDWEREWQMSFHPEKCEVIHITTKRNVINYQYSIHNQLLDLQVLQNILV